MTPKAQIHIILEPFLKRIHSIIWHFYLEGIKR